VNYQEWHEKQSMPKVREYHPRLGRWRVLPLPANQ
jgi:hypothetical protein